MIDDVMLEAEDKMDKALEAAKHPRRAPSSSAPSTAPR